MERCDRLTGPINGRYFVRAFAWYAATRGGAPILRSRADVFRGHPNQPGSAFVQGVCGERALDDMLDALQNAERRARDLIATLPWTRP
jgi:hypothetical protein